MRFLRVGKLGKEIPAAVDKKGNIRDLSSHIKDLNSETINFKILNKLNKIDLEALPQISKKIRIGSCVSKP